MALVKAVCYLLALAGFCLAQSNRYEVYYEWKQVDYNFPNTSVRESLIKNGGFIQKNVVPVGIKIVNDTVFVTTPRYLPGVPSTLNVIPYKKSWRDYFLRRRAGPKMTPFPSLEMQKEGNCTALQMVQAMELDPYNRLWLVDVGITEVATDSPKRLCPPKLVIIDLENGNKIDRAYEFPDNVASHKDNELKDIQVACTSREDCFSYISQLNPTSAIVVYNYKLNDSWSATHKSMQPDMEKANITIEGNSTFSPMGICGLGLTPKSTNYSRIFYSLMAGDRVYSVATDILKNSKALKNSPTLQDSDITDLGPKPMGQADGAAMDDRGRWYFGSLPDSAVYSMDVSGNPRNLPRITRDANSTTEMQWPDAFSFDGKGYLAFTTTRFHLFNEKINPEEVNYRIVRFRTGSKSYQN